MAGKGSVKRVQQALDSVLSTEDLLSRLDAARRVREAAEELERATVHELRQVNTSWARIGALYGTSKQGVQQRFGSPRAH